MINIKYTPRKTEINQKTKSYSVICRCEPKMPQKKSLSLGSKNTFLYPLLLDFFSTKPLCKAVNRNSIISPLITHSLKGKTS